VILGTTLANNSSIGFALLLACMQIITSPAFSQEAGSAPAEQSTNSPAAEEQGPASGSTEADDRKQTPAEAEDRKQTPAEPPPDSSAVELPESLQPELATWEPWSKRVDGLILQFTNLEQDANDADILYLEITSALRIRLSHLRNNLTGARSPLDKVVASADLPARVHTIEDLHASVEAMYAARLRLLEFVTPGLYLEVTATDLFGMQQLAMEFSFIWQQIRFQALNIPAAVLDLKRRVQIAPLPVIWRSLEFLLAFLIFRWWRRWLPETLRRMRASLLEIRPRSAAVISRIRVIWYVGQLRRPLEWLILFNVFFALIDMNGVNFITEIVAIVVRWILLGWFSVLLLNAVAARGDAGMTGENALLRERSLRLIAAWLVLLGLGFGIAESLAGVATLHAWVWRLFQILALPVLFILLSWWRGSIFNRLELEQESTDSQGNRLLHREGLRSYLGAASGAIWLLANSLRRRIMRNFLRIGSQEGLTGSLVSGQSDSGADPAASSEENPLPESIREKLLGRGEFYERYARAEQRSIINRAKRQQSGTIAITGERGIGMSCLLERLAESLGDGMILVDCRSGEYRELEQALGEALGIRTVNPKNVSQALSESGIHTVVINNLHRLVRPVMGGQRELIRLTELVENIRSNVLWIYSVDCYAWQFMRRARADRSTISEVIELQSWTEEQLSELLDQRNEEAAIDADFGETQVPREYMETALETAAARNKAGIYRMIWTRSAGNPSIALRMWADCLRPDDDGRLVVRAPAPLKIRDLERAAPNVLLVLRSIAQSELIAEQDIGDNLRLPQGAVSSAMHYAVLRGWIEETDGRYRLSWTWFRSITRVLARQNLLAR